MIARRDYEDLLAAELRNRRLSETFLGGRGGKPEHHWQTSVERVDLRKWRVHVGAGTVNDQVAAILYRREGDPRDWTMPEGYAPFAPLAAVFGEDYAFVDRPLWETPAPHLLLTAPSNADLGGFVKVADHQRPEFFATEAMWERDLYRAGVFVTISPYRSDPTQALLHTGGARATRWRLVAGRAPNAVADAGVAKIASHELARLWLTRVPGDPDSDEIHVQQMCFWSLRAFSVINQPLLSLIGVTAEMMAGLDFGLLALGVSGLTIGTALVGLQAELVALLVANLEAIVAATSSVKFWSAA